MADSYYLHLLDLYKDSRSQKTLLKQYRVSKTHFFEGNPCWEWQGSFDAAGYARCRKIINGYQEVYAHRAVYRAFVASIPDGQEIDHKCNRRSCGNPRHLQIATHQQNMQNGIERRPQCTFGHLFIEENTAYNKKGQRICKACRYRRIKEWRARHPEKARQVGRESKAQWRAKQYEKD